MKPGHVHLYIYTLMSIHTLSLWMYVIMCKIWMSIHIYTKSLHHSRRVQRRSSCLGITKRSNQRSAGRASMHSSGSQQRCMPLGSSPSLVWRSASCMWHPASSPSCTFLSKEARRPKRHQSLDSSEDSLSIDSDQWLPTDWGICVDVPCDYGMFERTW